MDMKVNVPTVSVIMAAYNDEAIIASAIQSIKDQTFVGWELIVIDDCSEDNVSMIIENFCDNDDRIRLIRNEKNAGLARCLNRGIAASQGQYIARMDADDISYPDRFQLQVAYLNKHPDIAVVGGNADFVDETGNYINKSNMPITPGEIKRVIARKCPLIHPSIMCRREFLIAMGGYDDKLRRAQDYDLWFRGSAMYNYANLDAVILKYTVQFAKPLKTDLYGFYVRCLNAGRQKNYLEGYLWALMTLCVNILKKVGYRSRGLRG